MTVHLQLLCTWTDAAKVGVEKPSWKRAFGLGLRDVQVWLHAYTRAERPGCVGAQGAEANASTLGVKRRTLWSNKARAVCVWSGNLALSVPDVFSCVYSK